MRIILKLTSNTETIPFEYQQKLVGVLHKWLGNNDIHDKISLYSFSWLMNGKIVSNGYDFSKGADWFINFYDDKMLYQIINSIQKDPEAFSGMSVTDIQIKPNPEFKESQVRFKLASPVFIKRKIGDGDYKFYTYQDKESGQLLTETLRHKMQEAGLPDDETLKISFDLDYENRKIKMVKIHNIKNKCSMCPVLITGKPETLTFAWNVGIGNQTGAAFGSLY